MRIDNDPRSLVAEVVKAGRGAPVAIEATHRWYWAVDALLAARSVWTAWWGGHCRKPVVCGSPVCRRVLHPDGQVVAAPAV